MIDRKMRLLFKEQKQMEKQQQQQEIVNTLAVNIMYILFREPARASRSIAALRIYALFYILHEILRWWCWWLLFSFSLKRAITNFQLQIEENWWQTKTQKPFFLSLPLNFVRCNTFPLIYSLLLLLFTFCMCFLSLSLSIYIIISSFSLSLFFPHTFVPRSFQRHAVYILCKI